MKVQGKVGQQILSNGSESDLRMSKNGSLVVMQGGGKYNESVVAGSVYIGANLGGTPVTTQAGLSATTPALTLYNPVGSGVYLSLLSVSVDITTSPAAAAGLMLAYNLATAVAPTTVTTANVTNALIGTAKQPTAACYRIATLAAAPLAFRFIGGTTGAAAISSTQLIDKIDGEVLVGPGTAISIQATSAIAILASFCWEEIPI